MNPFASVNIESTEHRLGSKSADARRLLTIHVCMLLLFPVFLAFSAIAMIVNDYVFAALIGMYGMVQTYLLYRGAHQLQIARLLVMPILFGLPLIFGYNRHWKGTPDNSPFSDGIGTVDQNAIGIVAYIRVFDEPFGEFGIWFCDWAALALNFELLIALCIVWLTIKCLLLRWSHGEPRIAPQSPSQSNLHNNPTAATR